MSNKKLIMPLSFIVVATILVGAFYFKAKTVNSPVQTNNIQTAGSKENSEQHFQEIELPKPTGNVDDAIGAVLGDVASEETLINKEAEDTADAIDEAKDTSDLDNLYEEDEL